MKKLRNAIFNYVQNQVWAIDPLMLDLIHEVLYEHYRYGSVDVTAAEEKMGRELKNTYDVQTRSNVLILPVHGIVGKRFNLMSAYSGGVSTDLLKRDIAKGLQDPAVDAIVLDLDSPGGTVSGVLELADFIYSSRGQKPIIGHANERANSAGYWIASAVDKLYASQTATVGSIGVFTRHYDYSKQLENEGIKPTYIYAGKYKTIGNEDEPLAGRERNIIQEEVDAIYTMFIDAVVKNRGISKDKVTENALSLLAQQALDRGLIDGIMTFDEAVSKAAEMAAERKRERQQQEYNFKASELNSKLDALLHKHRLTI